MDDLQETPDLVQIFREIYDKYVNPGKKKKPAFVHYLVQKYEKEKQILRKKKQARSRMRSSLGAKPYLKTTSKPVIGGDINFSPSKIPEMSSSSRLEHQKLDSDLENKESPVGAKYD